MREVLLFLFAGGEGFGCRVNGVRRQEGWLEWERGVHTVVFTLQISPFSFEHCRVARGSGETAFARTALLA